MSIYCVCYGFFFYPIYSKRTLSLDIVISKSKKNQDFAATTNSLIACEEILYFPPPFIGDFGNENQQNPSKIG